MIRPMKLTVWLLQTGTSRSEFARRIGVSPSSVTEYCSGRYTPRPAVAKRIIKATCGAVTANDFLDFEDAA